MNDNATRLEARKHIRAIVRHDEDLAETMAHMGEEELKERILASETNLLTNQREQEGNMQLERAKRRYEALKGPYDDARKFQTAIIKYGTILLSGEDVSPE